MAPTRRKNKGPAELSASASGGEKFYGMAGDGHELLICPLPNAGGTLRVDNAQVFLDKKPLKNVVSVKFDAKAGSLNLLKLELVLKSARFVGALPVSVEQGGPPHVDPPAPETQLPQAVEVAPVTVKPKRRGRPPKTKVDQAIEAAADTLPEPLREAPVDVPTDEHVDTGPSDYEEPPRASDGDISDDSGW